jgi:uncharacterized membrane protein
VIVSKFIVATLPSEAKAYDATRALRELHTEGSLTVYGVAVVAKDKDGKVSLKEAADAGPLGAAVGALVGGLIGVLGGPVGALVGAASGALIGSYEFVKKVSAGLAPGKTAVIAEVAERWDTPLDSRMAALGGTVLRSWRSDVEDEQVARNIALEKAEFDSLKSEYAHARDDAKAGLKVRIDNAKTRLDKAEAHGKARLEALDGELKAKIVVIEKQAAGAESGMKEKMAERLTALRAGYKARMSKLKQAAELTREAFAA